MRPHIAAIYAFARIADDFADEGRGIADATPAAARRLGARLDQAVSTSAQCRPPTRPASSRSSPRSRTRLPSATCRYRSFDDLLSAFRQDVMRQALRDMGRRAGLLPALGQPGRTSGAGRGRLPRRRSSTLRSDAVCTALQLTNFWQDLGRRLDDGPPVRAARRSRARRARTKPT